MTFSPAFFRATAVCAFLTALTTLGVHLYPRGRPSNLEEAIALHDDPAYLAAYWIVLVHILLVVASMWGAVARRLDRSAGPAVLALFGYLIFGMAELVRMALFLFAVNATWRAGIAGQADEAVRDRLVTHLEGWSGLNEALFFLLVLGFFLGNLLLGGVLWRGTGLERIAGGALLAWAALGALTLLSDHVGLAWLPARPGWLSWTFQPAVRLIVGAWLWSAAHEQGGACPAMERAGAPA